ncbi:hypothetical protein NLI96_g4184 [Meripilus lineatus]|uniref:G domain-containing protein n=1 Tax=Meripilus lineatus TaxID=2056292 RepID=A0AAD5V5D5_9APHY|nr:hypothetical protein NLI96_g4184 [Physisporinus lineatus]
MASFGRSSSIEDSSLTLPPQLVPTMDVVKHTCETMRILVLGEKEIGKTTLIRRMFPVGFTVYFEILFLDRRADTGVYLQENESSFTVDEPADDNDGLPPEINMDFPRGGQPEHNLWIYEYNLSPPRSSDELPEDLAKFITQRSSPALSCAERIHVIWYLVVLTPIDEKSPLPSVDKIIQLCANCKVPIVFVFTKYDALVKDRISKIYRKNELTRLPDAEAKAHSEASVVSKELCSSIIDKIKSHNLQYTFFSMREGFETSLRSFMQSVFQGIFPSQSLNTMLRGSHQPWYKVLTHSKAGSMGLSHKEMEALGLILASVQHANVTLKVKYCVLLGSIGIILFFKTLGIKDDLIT